MKKGNFFKFCSFMLIVLTTASIGVSALSENATEVLLYGGRNLHINLKAGKTSVKYSNFSKDLTALLKEKGALVNDKSITVEENQTLTTNAFDWWQYDHTNGTPVIDDTKHSYIESQNVSEIQSSGNYELPNHIEIEDKGATFSFKGYGSSGYKDFLYLPNSSSEKKIFSFSLEEKEAHDALDGTGFLFNTNVTGSYGSGQVMSGYFLMLGYSGSGVGNEITLYSFENVDTKTFHNSTSNLISGSSGFKALATAPYSSTDKFRKFKLITTKDSVQLYYKGNASSFDSISGEFSESDLVTFTSKADSSKTTTYKITNNVSTSYGFGTLISYRPHSCSEKTNFQFTNVSMVDEKNVSLTEGEGKPEDTDSFMIYLEDNVISDLKNTDTVNDLIEKLNATDTYYIGWGTNANKTDSLSFIDKYKKGTFISSDDGSSYDEQLNKIVQAIVSNTDVAEAHTTDIIVGDKIEFKPRHVELTGTDGAWKVVYVDLKGEEVSSTLDDLVIDTNVTGTYKIYYKDSLLNTINIKEEVVKEVPATGVSTSNIVLVIGSGIILVACIILYKKQKGEFLNKKNK